MDFRAEAAAATAGRLTSTGKSLVDLGESGCVPVPGGRSSLYLVELPAVILSTACMLMLLAAVPLMLFGRLSRPVFFLILLVGLAISLLTRSVKALILKAVLARRTGTLISRDLPLQPVGLEEGKTYKKIKLVIEDRGVSTLDAERHQLLVEGCAYRYVICARDVFSVQAVSGYALSGARVVCRMAGQPFDIVLMADGHGPLASFIQAFDPSLAAKGLANVINRTLFGVETATYQQRELPPPLPGAAPPPPPPPPPMGRLLPPTS